MGSILNWILFLLDKSIRLSRMGPSNWCDELGSRKSWAQNKKQIDLQTQPSATHIPIPVNRKKILSGFGLPQTYVRVLFMFCSFVLKCGKAERERLGWGRQNPSNPLRGFSILKIRDLAMAIWWFWWLV